MSKLQLLLIFLTSIAISSVSLAVDDVNIGKVLKIGKVSATACTIKVQGATFPNNCTTATYQEAYFTCDATQGREFLSIGLAAYVSGKPITLNSTGCSVHGSSVANISGLYME